MSILPDIALTSMPECGGKTTELPLFQEYAYDFEADELELRNGSTYLVSENNALQIWVYKALYTNRYRYIAYTRDFGVEFWSMVGSANSSDVVKSELQRYIIEALMVNPYILELSKFEMSVVGSSLAVGFDCLTIYGMMRISYTFEGVM